VHYKKITKTDKICIFEIYILSSRRLLFLCSPKYKIFEQDFLHVGRINGWLHANIFFQIFLKLRSMIFKKKLKTRSLVPMYTKSLLLSSIHISYLVPFFINQQELVWIGGSSFFLEKKDLLVFRIMVLPLFRFSSSSRVSR
jgi:hypothetical protein